MQAADSPAQQTFCCLLQTLPGHVLLGPGWSEAAGIFAVALSGPSGSALPTLRASMKQPKKFKQVLWASFGVMLVSFRRLLGLNSAQTLSDSLSGGVNNVYVILNSQQVLMCSGRHQHAA